MAARKATPRFIAAVNTPWISCPKIKIEVVLGDSQVTSAVDAIVKAAKTGKIGDGKVFVSTIENAIRIRTEETGEQAV